MTEIAYALKRYDKYYANIFTDWLETYKLSECYLWQSDNLPSYHSFKSIKLKLTLI